MYVLFGAIVGLLSFLPLIVALKKSKKVTPTSSFGYGALLMLGIFVSLIILIVAVLICYFCARDGLIAFVLAAAITLILFAIVYGVYSVVSRNKAANKRANNKAKGK